MAKEVGLDLAIGDEINMQDIEKITEHMAELLVQAITAQPLPQDVAHLFLTDLPPQLFPLDGIIFSGGVGEYVAARETRYFDDLGMPFGTAVRSKVDANKFKTPMLPAVACIRATALGASEYSVQLSGQTSTITTPGKVLPRRNMQVLKPYLDLTVHPTPDAIAKSILKHFTAFDLDPAEQDVALVFEYRLEPDYAYIKALADGIFSAMATRLAGGHPLYIIIDGDIAQTLGGILREELKISNELLVLDGLSLRDFDYIDLGKIRLPSFTVPVTVKSLLFAENPDGPHRAERVHFRETSTETSANKHHHDHHHHSHD